MFITKKKHEAIVSDLQEEIAFLEKRLESSQDLKKVLETLTSNSKNYLTADCVSGITLAAGGGWEVSLPNTVPVYVEDVLGGKVIKQEATPVTILDEQGKATYGYTKEKADKGRAYKLIQK